MKLKLSHKIRINVSDDTGEKKQVLTGGVRKLPSKLLKALFGETAEVLILSPGKTVGSIEIHEEGGEPCESEGTVESNF